MAEWNPPKFGSPCWMSIAAKDVERASAFYATVFNWTFKPSTTEFPPDEIQMVEFRPDVQISGGIVKSPDTTGVINTGHGGTCICWLVEDVEAIAGVIEKAGGKILSDTTPMSRSGLYRYFEDTEGNLGCAYQFVGASA